MAKRKNSKAVLISTVVSWAMFALTIGLAIYAIAAPNSFARMMGLEIANATTAAGILYAFVLAPIPSIIISLLVIGITSGQRL